MAQGALKSGLRSPIRIGHIVTSGNSVLEPLTYAINRSVDGLVSHHFTRLAVTQLSLAEESGKQFSMDRMLAAAKLLADAPLDVIVWNGTAASWRGLQHDTDLCAAIGLETGIPATTSTIACYTALRTFGWIRVALAVPYTSEITQQIEKQYALEGFQVTASACMGLRENAEIGTAEPEAIKQILRDAAKSEPDCIAVVCTNLAAAPLVAKMEKELAIPIVDSIAATFWEACRVAKCPVSIRGWGRLLEGGEVARDDSEGKCG